MEKGESHTGKNYRLNFKAENPKNINSSRDRIENVAQTVCVNLGIKPFEIAYMKHV